MSEWIYTHPKQALYVFAFLYMEAIWFGVIR